MGTPHCGSDCGIRTRVKREGLADRLRLLEPIDGRFELAIALLIEGLSQPAAQLAKEIVRVADVAASNEWHQIGFNTNLIPLKLLAVVTDDEI